jgi:hypothetical protein
MSRIADFGHGYELIWTPRLHCRFANVRSRAYTAGDFVSPEVCKLVKRYRSQRSGAVFSTSGCLTGMRRR